MNILCIGDVVGSQGCQFLRAHLPALKKTKAIDLVIANGENSADGNGITRSLFQRNVKKSRFCTLELSGGDRL